ncbi:MAG TPA: hypothetical protein VKB57_16480 [Acidimicrobiales bacterium]|nr:hypothetical protein [Acidimicrobiales bacterium]
MIVELALATRTAPADWWDEDDAVIATAIDILDERAQARRR